MPFITDPIDINIGIDNVAAMFELTDMLVQRGYQNIGLLCANGNSGSFSSIYRDGIKLCYAIICLPTVLLTLLCHLFFHRSITTTEFFRMAELDAPYVSDELACGVLYECQRRRIKVPDELAVVGFGDSDVSKVCQPSLTTMAVPHRKIGLEAGNVLLERIKRR